MEVPDLGYQEYITIIDEIAQVCGSIGLSVAAHNSLCTGHILQFGTDEQKRKWLPKLATAEWIGAWGLTETGTGSDAGGMDTTAVLDGNHYVLNGSKNWITHAISSEIAVVIARTGEKGDSRGMTAFVVEKSTPGFTAGQKENKLGMRASETACLFFDDCRVPKENILGKVGEGLYSSHENIRRWTYFDRRTYPLVLLAGQWTRPYLMRTKGCSLVRKFVRFKE